MLYKCLSCDQLRLSPRCMHHKPGEEPKIVPLEAGRLPVFTYQPEGLVERVLPGPRREKKAAWQQLVHQVLTEYEELRSTYFESFIQLSDSSARLTPDPQRYPGQTLFEDVLRRIGFKYIDKFPNLGADLVHVTRFQMEYRHFASRVMGCVSPTYVETIQKWTEEQGGAFRKQLPAMIYVLYETDGVGEDVAWNPNPPPVILSQEYRECVNQAEGIYRQVLIDRLQRTLEGFDPTMFVTLGAVDGMSGRQFEDFLVTMYETLGYQIEETPHVGDQGADLVVERGGRRMVVQAKRYLEGVGNAAVQQAAAARTHYGAQEAVVITNSFFTKSAEELAESTGVTLVSRDELGGLLDEYNRQHMEATGAGEDPEREVVV